MSEDSASKKPSYLPIAGALFFGIVVGVAMSDGEEAALGVKRDLEARVAAAEEAVAAAEQRAAAAVESAQAAVSSGADQAAQTVAEQVAALESKMAEMTESVSVDVTGDEAFNALNSRVQVLAEQMAGIIGELRTGVAAPAPSAPAGESAPAEAPPAEAAPAADTAALEAKIGESGFAIAVGQTGEAGDTRVFMARIDTAADSARVMVVGEGPSIITVGGEPLTLENGCALTLEGLADRRAFISVACGA
jgi:hypothetical protein